MILRYFLLVLVCTFIATFAFGQSNHVPFQVTPYTEFRFFGWKEFGDNGEQLLQESGTLYAFGAVPRWSFGEQRKFFVEADGSVYFGSVDYDGFLQDAQGQRTPFKTSTVYFGLEFASAAGYALPLSRQFALTPTAGFGIEYWNRNLDNGGVNGYDEKYTVIYFHGAATGTYNLSSDIEFFSSFGMKIPFSISESIDLASRGQGGPADVSLSPGVSPRFRFGAGTNVHNVMVELSFETWTLVKSNEDKTFHQPESTRKIFGIKLGYTL